jgi:endonuclease/exonuclease/phosphatase family metal-dependent hydrolase
LLLIVSAIGCGSGDRSAGLTGASNPASSLSSKTDREQEKAIPFVSTHLESFHPGIRMLQARELALALATESRPVVLVGDLNSHPGTEGAAILAGAGFRDVWAELHPSRPGLTCCWPEDLTKSNPGFSERIDYVLFRGPLEPRTEAVSGADPASRVAGLWPSDHGGLFAELRLEEQEDDSEDEQREERGTSMK